MEQVQILRLMWVQHFHLVEGEVQRRGPKDRPPGAKRLVTPYDPEARGGVKRDIMWDGYKVHLTETCEPDALNLITNMTTTLATTADGVMSQEIHASLAARSCLPSEHWVDAGYPTAAQVVAARAEHGVDLHGPMAANTSTQSDGRYGLESFTIDWEQQEVTCPNGVTTTQWYPRTDSKGIPVIRVRFRHSECRPCPHLRDCVGSATGQRREIMLRHREEHDVIRQRRAEQETDAWQNRYKIRAGVEGTISQSVHRCNLRRSRYQGLAKTSLQHQLTGAAINLIRIDAHLTGTPRARTRTSHFARLRPAEQQLEGAGTVKRAVYPDHGRCTCDQ